MPKSMDKLELNAVIETLRSVRREAGLSQAQVAAANGYPQNWASQAELGKRRLDYLQLRGWSEVCGLSMTQFVERVETVIAAIPSTKRTKAGSELARRYLGAQARRMTRKIKNER